MAIPPSHSPSSGAPSGGSAWSDLRIDPSDRPTRSGTGSGSPPKEPKEPKPPKPPKPPKEPRPPKEPKPPRRKAEGSGGKGGGRSKSWLGRMVAWAVSLAIWCGVALAAVVGYYAYDLPDINTVTATTRRPAVTFVSQDGENFASYGDIFGETVALDRLPAYLPQAVMATEDRRFYDHFGVDPIGLLRALAVNLRAGHTVQGGSTLTQQLAKNLFLSPERNMKRKVQELLMAFWLERKFTKDQIMTLYLNRVYLGSGTFGVDAAAKRYFNLHARELSLYQSALVAGLLKAPSRYNPLADPEASKKRTTQVLANMVAAGYITEQQAQAALSAGPGQVRRNGPGGRYFADWLYDQVRSYTGDEERDLVVYTTLNMKLQRKAEADLDAMLAGPGAKAKASQGAVVVLSPDGAVRAMAGGRDYNDSQFNRATQSLRQPGSSFKPFVYLAALEQGMSPDDIVEDAPIKIGNWRPQNYTNNYMGPVPLRTALAKSLNTVAVRLTEQVGARRVASVAQRLGITSPLRADTSIALGTSEVSLIDLVSAYAAFANGGNGVWAYGVAEIRDRDGNTVYQREGGGPGRVIAPGPLAGMNAMMSGVISPEGTGKSAMLDRPAAGKSGTTQDYKDAWFVGFTADVVTGVWLGNDDGSLMNKVTGGGLPAQLWRGIMLAAHAGLPPRDLPGLGANAIAVPQAEEDYRPRQTRQPNTPPPAQEEDGIWNSLVRSLTGG